MVYLAKLEAHSLCDSKQYRYTIYTTKSSNNAPWYGLSAKGVQGFGVFFECVQTITSRFYCLHNKEPICLETRCWLPKHLEKEPFTSGESCFAQRNL